MRNLAARVILALGSCMLLMVLVSPAGAGVVVYDNGYPNLENGFMSDVYPDPGILHPRQVADDFILGISVAITDVHWWGGYGFENPPPIGDDFTIQFYEDNGGEPTQTPFAEIHVGDIGRTDTGLDWGDKDIFMYSADIDPIFLEAGTTYYLSVFNSIESQDEMWFWVSGGDSSVFGKHWDRLVIPPTPWREDRWDVAFRLTTPEPTSLVGLGVCLMGLYLGRRRIKR